MIPLSLLPLLLSEVLANEPGSVTSLEFVELVARQPVQEGFFVFDANGKTVAVPVVPLDSGDFIVICRDAARFEQHFGDSSGTWGDSGAEDYPLQEFGLSLPNGSGYVALSAGAVEDRFQWSGAAGDGVSYERVSDSLWQTTDPTQGSTPGRRNTGSASNFDWSIEGFRIEPVMPRSGESALVTVRLRNRGLVASSGILTALRVPNDSLPSQPYSGQPGEVVELVLELLPNPGQNELVVLISADDRASNNFASWSFYADSGPMFISELYPAPMADEPEWLELFAPQGFDYDPAALSLADLSDTVQLALGSWSAGDYRFVVFTADSARFALAFPGVLVPVIQPHDWPALNNDGDSLAVLLGGTVVDRAGYPSVGSRRGISFERVGATQVWGWSAAPQGSTPGAVNSIDVDYSAGIEVEVSPNPFAAGQGEAARFRYLVPFAAEGEMTLYRGDGRQVCKLFGRRRLVSGEVSWDGMGDEGGFVPVGIYIVQFKLYEPQELVHLSTVVVAR